MEERERERRFVEGGAKFVQIKQREVTVCSREEREKDGRRESDPSDTHSFHNMDGESSMKLESSEGFLFSLSKVSSIPMVPLSHP